MPNHASCRYMFGGGYQMWWLDTKKTKVKATISFCKSNLAVLEKAEQNELSHLAQKFDDLTLKSAQKGTRDHRLSRKIRQIWDEQDDTWEEMEYAEQNLEMVESEIKHYMHSTD